MKVIEQKIRSLYHSTVFLWLLTAFFHIFSFSCVCLCRHFVCFSSIPRPRTQILSVFILAAILNKFPLSVDKSVTWFLLCARVFSPAAAILESEKTLGTRLGRALSVYSSDYLLWNQFAFLMFLFERRVWCQYSDFKPFKVLWSVILLLFDHLLGFGNVQNLF